MQPTSSGGLRHPDASEFSEHPIKEVPEVSVKPLGLLCLVMGRWRGRVFKMGQSENSVAILLSGYSFVSLRHEKMASITDSIS